MREVFDLTIAVTAHNEGLLAHKTILSVMAGVEKLKESGYTYEIIVHIDNGDKDTISYFLRYENNRHVRIFENNFGDTGSSRNFVVSRARGKYIAFLDGDDLISDNWFVGVVDLLERSKDSTIVHPEAVLTFGIDQEVNVLSIQKPSYAIEKDTIILLGENRWCSVAAAKRGVFQNNLYPKLGPGYGHEDYVFDVETVYSGVKHEIVKGTVLFYRRSENSRLSKGNQNHVTIPYMKLFDFDRVKGLNEVPVEDFDERLKNRGYMMYKKIRGNDFLNFFITPVAKMALRVINGELPNKKKVPDFVIKEWTKINKIETQLYPYKWLVRKVQLYEAEKQVLIGDGYLKIAQSVTTRPDYIFVVPWVVRGGADKVMLNYIKALHEIKPKWHFAIVTTLENSNTWAGQLPGYVDLIEFGRIAHGLVPEQKDGLFTRMIVQLNCKKIHIINSEYGYRWAARHKELLRTGYVVNVSLFCEEFIPGSNLKGVFSYDDPYLFDIYDVVDNVFLDNKTMKKKTIEHNGFDGRKFKVHYQPVNDMDFKQPKKELIEDGKVRVLWAGRIVPTKLPELVARIGKNVDPNVIRIDVFGEKSREINDNIFDNISSVHYMGTFDGFKTIPTNEYDAFLYTALDDGVPNVLLEAAAAGLPIIASNDGGVGEFVVDGKSGILIKDYLNFEPYVEVLNILSKGEIEVEKYAKNAQDLLRKQHSWDAFIENVKHDFGKE